MRAVRARRALPALLLGVLACGRSSDSLVDVQGTARVPITVVVALDEDVPTFKVDGRLGLVWESASIPVGGTDVGVRVLPAGARTATFEVRVPFWLGVLRIREETVTPAAPFLCGSTEAIDPRQVATATAVIVLCQP